MNSLLNVELRERRGLVYSVEASTAMFRNCGLMTVYFGCDADDLARCRRICSKVFGDIADGRFTAQKLEKAKKQYIGQLAIASENMENRIMAAARAALFRNEAPGFGAAAGAIHDISIDQIRIIAESMTNAAALVYTSTNS